MSDRGLQSATTTYISGRVVRPVVFVKIEFPSANFYAWTGQGDLQWDGQTWIGTGHVMEVSSPVETTDGSAQGITIKFSGLDSTMLSDLIDDEWQGSLTSVWFGFVEDKAAVDDPIKIFGGRLDTGKVDDDGKTSTIEFKAESLLVDQLKPRVWKYTDNDQQDLYAGDVGLEHVARIQDLRITWGR